MMRVRASFMVVLLFAVAAGTAFAADPLQMTVTVEKTQVRATPGSLGKLLGDLAYGEKVTVLDQPADAPKGWLKVMGPDRKLQGWVKSRDLLKKVTAMKAGSETAAQSASSGDVALAGKGFNKDVEAQYMQDQKLDYTWVDKMVAYTLSPQVVDAFLSAGGLSGQGGAQ